MTLEECRTKKRDGDWELRQQVEPLEVRWPDDAEVAAGRAPFSRKLKSVRVVETMLARSN